MSDAEQATTLAGLGKQALADLLNNLTQAKDFALSQLPDVCNQYVALGRFSCTAMFIGSMIFLIGAIVYLFFLHRHYKIMSTKGMHYDHDFMGFLFTIPTLLMLATGIALFCNSMNDISSWIAPKVYLIKEISNLLK